MATWYIQNGGVGKFTDPPRNAANPPSLETFRRYGDDVIDVELGYRRESLCFLSVKRAVENLGGTLASGDTVVFALIQGRTQINTLYTELAGALPTGMTATAKLYIADETLVTNNADIESFLQASSPVAAEMTVQDLTDVVVPTGSLGMLAVSFTWATQADLDACCAICPERFCFDIGATVTYFNLRHPNCMPQPCCDHPLCPVPA